MSKRITLQFEGRASVSFVAPDAMLRNLGAEKVEAIRGESLAVSRIGLEFALPDAGRFRWFQYAPAPLKTIAWPDYFDQCGLPNKARFGNADAPVSFSGPIAALVCSGWTALNMASMQAAKSRGRPRRNQDWNQDREEIFAQILERIREREDSVIDAIRSVSQVDAARFGRTFKGKTIQAKIDSARQYFYSRKRETG